MYFQYIAELSLLEAEPYLQFKPSVIAASALATARHCLLCERSGCDMRSSDDQPVHAQCANIGNVFFYIYITFITIIISGSIIKKLRLLCFAVFCINYVLAYQLMKFNSTIDKIVNIF